MRNLPEVFREGSENWIEPGAAAAEDVIAAIERCPSGALTWTRGEPTQFGPAADEAAEASVRIVRNGPYLVSGFFDFQPERWGTGSLRTRYALCRCGKSNNAPFCDYSHGEQNWSDED